MNAFYRCQHCGLCPNCCECEEEPEGCPKCGSTTECESWCPELAANCASLEEALEMDRQKLRDMEGPLG